MSQGVFEMNCAAATDEDMQTIIDARVQSIRNAYANNLLEGIDVGADFLEAILQRAKQPISDEDFAKRELALWDKRWATVEN